MPEQGYGRQAPYGQPSVPADQGFAQPAYGQQQPYAAQLSHGQQSGYGMSAPAEAAYGQPGYGQPSPYGDPAAGYAPAAYGAAPGEKRIKGITIAALILGGLGFLGMWAAGSGWLFALIGAILGFVAMKKNPEAKPWPMIAAVGSSVVFIICLVLVIIMLVNWIPYFTAISGA